MDFDRDTEMAQKRQRSMAVWGVQTFHIINKRDAMFRTVGNVPQLTATRQATSSFDSARIFPSFPRIYTDFENSGVWTARGLSCSSSWWQEYPMSQNVHLLFSFLYCCINVSHFQYLISDLRFSQRCRNPGLVGCDAV